MNSGQERLVLGYCVDLAKRQSQAIWKEELIYVLLGSFTPEGRTESSGYERNPRTGAEFPLRHPLQIY